MAVRERWNIQGPVPDSLIFVVKLLILLSVLPAAAQTNLAGYWVLHVPNGDGTQRSTFFELQQQGEAITGTLHGQGSRLLPLTGSFKDGKLEFRTTPPPPPPGTPAGAFRPRSMTFTGGYQEGKLALQTQNFRGETLNGVAERTTREASLPPARLPLPPLHDLPDNGLARTPPMGWNSWNKFAGKVDDAAVRSMADAMVASGMSKLGYLYINIDDTWQGGRDAAGNILPNRKFPDMKALAEYVHAKGLKIGIYSSPGPTTCAGYEGSFGHETQDANTFADWGMDYIKYDLCSGREIYKPTQDDQQGVYQKMGEALQNTHRPIVYSLCQYGQADVWKWGGKTSGNLWRTTGDIRDEWASMDRIGFSQIDIAVYARPGQWNDPDMLEVGNGGMTTEEYRTHMSLWSLLAAPLMAGNDLRSMSDDTKSILMNADVIAIDQDEAVKPVEKLAEQEKVEILDRPLQDGSVAVGIFNRGETPASGTFSWQTLKLPGNKLIARDLWKHEAVPTSGDSFTATVPAHGVVLLKVSAK